MIRRPPRSTRTDTLFPYTTLFRSLRQRVGMPPLTIAFVSGANLAGVQLDMLEEIRRERRIALAGEGLRYYDLIRWKTAEAELSSPVMGIISEECRVGQECVRTCTSRGSRSL